MLSPAEERKTRGFGGWAAVYDDTILMGLQGYFSGFNQTNIRIVSGNVFTPSLDMTRAMSMTHASVWIAGCCELSPLARFFCSIVNGKSTVAVRTDDNDED